MRPVRIALFTPFSPITGGGGVIFRSLLPYLEGAEIQWFYLSNATIDFPSATRLGSPVMGGPVVKDGINSLRMFLLQSHPEIDRSVRAILDWAPDIVWVNAMNEGLLVGKKLLDAGIKHLHVTVHDDPAGLAQKSSRYRVVAPLFDRRNSELLRRAHSVDVVCDSMRTYYSDRIGVSSGVVYRYIGDQSLPAPKLPAPHVSPDEPMVELGHVGSAYSAPEVFAFLEALRGIAKTDGRRFRLTNFGISPAMTAAEKAFPEIVVNAGNVAEPDVIERLQKCSFVYSMYSFDPRHRIFRETSQPTKMSTYLMAAKPILAHCPEGSSTLEMLSRFKLGVCCTSLDGNTIAAAVRSILGFRLDGNEVRRAAEYYCGQRNLDYLRQCFGLEPES